MNKKLERLTFWRPAFDKRDSNPLKNYGVGSVKCIMVLKGPKGAVHFVWAPGMYLPSVYEWWASRGLHTDGNKPDYMGYDVGYHSPKPTYKGQSLSMDKCDYLDGPCYTDGSGLRADTFMKIFVEEGDEAIWKKLEEDYDYHFGPKKKKTV